MLMLSFVSTYYYIIQYDTCIIQSRVELHKVTYKYELKIPLLKSPETTQSVERQDFDPKVAWSIHLCVTICLPKMFAC